MSLREFEKIIRKHKKEQKKLHKENSIIKIIKCQVKAALCKDSHAVLVALRWELTDTPNISASFKKDILPKVLKKINEVWEEYQMFDPSKN